MEKTLAIIKPTAVANKNTGDIISLIELNGFNIKSITKKHLTREEAETFYGIHKGKPFFEELIEYMTSGPIVALCLEKEDAIKDWRTFIGPTNPKDYTIGSIRNMFATSFTKNAVHGSDSPENAKIELKFFGLN